MAGLVIIYVRITQTSVDMINLLPTCKFTIPNIQISRSSEKADGVVVLVSVGGDGGDREAEIHLYGVIERGFPFH